MSVRLRPNPFGIVTLIIAALLVRESSASALTCTACQCYKVRCSRIENADIDCDEDFEDTCDNSLDIVERDNCHLQCGCCLQGQCYSKSSYYCVIFRTYEFFSVTYFLALSANFFMLWHLYKYFFRLKRPFDKAHFNELDKDSRDYFRYTQRIWIQRYRGFSKVVIPDKRAKEVAGLFGRIEQLRPLAIRNLSFFLGMVTLCLLMVGISAFVMFFLMDQPILYGKLTWIQHILYGSFYGLSFLVGKQMKSYRDTVNELLGNFEDEKGCKVKIVRNLQLLEINWEPKATVPRLSHSKRVSKLIKSEKDHSAENIEDETMRVKVVDVKEGKPKVFTSKVAPL